MDFDKKLDINETKDASIRWKLFWFWFFIILIFPIFINFIIAMFNDSLKPYDSKRYLLKILETIINNISYYGTAFGIYAGMIQFYVVQKQRENEFKKSLKVRLWELKKEKQKMTNDLIKNQKLKEEESKNIYRPTFYIEKNNIKLKMNKEDLFLENIVYYPCIDGDYDKKWIKIGTKKSGDIIIEGTKEKPIPDNFYITADTILGEKILFGFLFGNNKIYKSLNENGNPLMPRGNLQEKYILSEINKNWTGYNFTNINEEVEKQFFYNSQGVRENLYLGDSSNVYIKEILESKNHKELYNNLFDNLTDWYSKPKKFTDNSIIEVINAVYNQVYYNADLFKMSNINIRVDYVIKIIQALDNIEELKDKKELFEVTEELKKYFQAQNFENIKLILNCINEIVGYAKNLPNESNGKYRVLECCLNILKEFFKNVEEEKENNKLLQSNFLSNKSEILNKIEFEEE